MQPRLPPLRGTYLGLVPRELITELTEIRRHCNFRTIIRESGGYINLNLVFRDRIIPLAFIKYIGIDYFSAILDVPKNIIRNDYFSIIELFQAVESGKHNAYAYIVSGNVLLIANNGFIDISQVNFNTRTIDVIIRVPLCNELAEALVMIDGRRIIGARGPGLFTIGMEFDTFRELLRPFSSRAESNRIRQLVGSLSNVTFQYEL